MGGTRLADIVLTADLIRQHCFCSQSVVEAAQQKRYPLLKVSNYADARRYELAAQQRLEAEIRRDCPSAPIMFFHRRKYVGRSGVEHEIDVAAEVEVAQMKLVFVAECRNHRSALQKRQVMAFAECVDDIGAHKGIMVAPNGFQSGAIEYARSQGIALFSLASSDVSSPWEVLVPLGALLGVGYALWKRVSGHEEAPTTSSVEVHNSQTRSEQEPPQLPRKRRRTRTQDSSKGRVAANRLKQEREQLGLSTQQLSEFAKTKLEVQISAKTLTRIEKGKQRYSRVTYDRVLRIVNTGREQLKDCHTYPAQICFLRDYRVRRRKAKAESASVRPLIR